MNVNDYYHAGQEGEQISNIHVFQPGNSVIAVVHATTIIDVFWAVD